MIERRAYESVDDGILSYDFLIKIWKKIHEVMGWNTIDVFSLVYSIL